MFGEANFVDDAATRRAAKRRAGTETPRRRKGNDERSERKRRRRLTLRAFRVVFPNLFAEEFERFFDDFVVPERAD